MEALEKELAVPQTSPDEPVGDGKAVFLEFGTEDEEEEFVRLEEKGWKGFYKRIFNINKKNETNS